MRNRTKLTAFAAVTAAAVAALFLAANTGGAAATPPETAAPQLSAAQLDQILVPASRQPATAKITKPMTLAEAMATHQFEAGPGLTSKPDGCLTMTDALGDLSKITGTLQSGERSAKVAPNSLQRYFLSAVFQIPGGADKALDAVAKVISTCGAGTLQLDTGNGAVRAGTISYRTHSAVTPRGTAKTLDATLTTTFRQDATTKGTAAKAAAGDGDVVVACDAELSITADGNELLWSVEPTKELSATAVSTMYSNLQAVR